MTAYRAASGRIETALYCFAQAVELVPHPQILPQHQAVHDVSGHPPAT